MSTNSRFDQLISDGLAASRDGRREDALALFAEASALAPASGVPPFLIASEQAAAGNTDAAETAFANAVLLAPTFRLARYQLGLLQFSSQRAAVALLTWQPLLELPDTDALLHFVRGFTELAQDRFDQALRHFQAGLQCQDANPAACADIRKIVEEVERLRVATQDSAPLPSSETNSSHVLLSGYGKALH